MQLSRFALLLAVSPPAIAAPALTTSEVDCKLGANKCDNDNGAVMLGGANGWKSTKTCLDAGACHVEPAGNAFCEIKPQCTPGASPFDAANYVSKVCNDEGLWKTDRKCSTPGCCEIQDDKAVCKVECGPGQQLPAARSTLKATHDWPKPGDTCKPDGEEYCDYTHNTILECVAFGIFTLKKTCPTKGGCCYDNASLVPHCR